MSTYLFLRGNEDHRCVNRTFVIQEKLSLTLYSILRVFEYFDNIDLTLVFMILEYSKVNN